MNTVVAESVLVAQSPDGNKKDVRVAVGKPYVVDDTCWACPIAIDGLHESLPDIHGVDSWHAMALGLLVVRELLAEFVEGGGTLAARRRRRGSRCAVPSGRGSGPTGLNPRTKQLVRCSRVCCGIYSVAGLSPSGVT